MSVKPLEINDTPFGTVQRKYELFNKDINYIIANRIEYCEIEEMPYKESISVQDLGYRARKACRDYFWETYGCAPITTDFFSFKKKREDTKYHFFCRFNISVWDKMLKEQELDNA